MGSRWGQNWGPEMGPSWGFWMGPRMGGETSLLRPLVTAPCFGPLCNINVSVYHCFKNVSLFQKCITGDWLELATRCRWPRCRKGEAGRWPSHRARRCTTESVRSVRSRRPSPSDRSGPRPRRADRNRRRWENRPRLRGRVLYHAWENSTRSDWPVLTCGIRLHM